ncbi:MAG: HepT-like ribonuclease domain-containing protein, partial [Pseudomonadota bacterium]
LSTKTSSREKAVALSSLNLASESMAAEPQHPLSDLRDQSKRVLTFTTNVTRESFGNDILRVYAVERCFEIIGEAMRRLERIDPSLVQRFERWQEVIAFRNLLAHSYHRV